MAEYTGSSLYLTFGTTVLNAEYRKFSVEESIGLKDASAGGDTARTYLTELTDGKATYEATDQTGTTTVGGSATWTALAKGTSGTLLWAPEGTASGKPKHTVVAIVKNRKRDIVYDDVTKISVEWQFSGAVTDAVY
jgi:hypothetical protein